MYNFIVTVDEICLGTRCIICICMMYWLGYGYLSIFEHHCFLDQGFIYNPQMGVLIPPFATVCPPNGWSCDTPTNGGYLEGLIIWWCNFKTITITIIIITITSTKYGNNTSYYCSHCGSTTVLVKHSFSKWLLSFAVCETFLMSFKREVTRTRV